MGLDKSDLHRSHAKAAGEYGAGIAFSYVIETSRECSEACAEQQAA